VALNSIEELVEDIRQGKMVILMDDEDRENEGDLIMAAECCKPEHINFMAKHARGLICMPMSRERCELLKLPLMAPRNGSGFGTKFTVSIEAPPASPPASPPPTARAPCRRPPPKTPRLKTSSALATSSR
jgi:3,4-dihydroxy 2-butanone 4-phosphate synthase/GTP cyclohydrolase II